MGIPFCKSITLDKNASLHHAQMIKCPSKNCGKIYSSIRYSKCQKLIFSKENENIMGDSVRCPYQSCGEYTLISLCPFCKIKDIYSGQRTNFNEGENITCLNCKQKYKSVKDNKLYNNKLSILEEITGENIDYGIGEIDDNFFLMKKDLFYIQDKKT